MQRNTALLAACEADFTLMSDWFTGVKFIFNFPLPAQIINASGGGSWNDPSDLEVQTGKSSAITLKPGSDKSVEIQ